MGTMDTSAREARHVTSSGVSVRAFLLSEVLNFVEQARTCPGVQRIALVGSLTRNKNDPKDADVLISVDDAADLAPLAAAGRRLKGRAQSRNKGADIFLVDPRGIYIGRTCHWRECRPGIRMACIAQHCGHRAYLHDDLDNITLAADLIMTPPVEIWPIVVRHSKLPDDVETLLVQPIEVLHAHIEAHGASAPQKPGRLG